MSSSRIAQAIGLLVGVALAAGALWSVFFLDWSRPIVAPELVIRPVQTAIVGERPPVERTFPARVRATNEVTISFQVPGVIQQLPATRGQRVTEGTVLAQLDQRDFASRLDAARVQSKQASEELDAVNRAFERGASTPIEVVRFRAAADRARSEMEIAEKALEDTTLLAPFDGVIADVFVDNFQKVSIGTRVLRLHGSEPVRVEVNVDAARVALNRRFSEHMAHAVRFDFLPNRSYEARLVEFTTEADRATQTFLAIFEIDMPEDVYVLPGMTATLTERVTAPADPSGELLAVPVESVMLDGSGNASVWVVGGAAPDGVAVVSRRRVTVGEPTGDVLVVREGLKPGERIVTAGTRELDEGQRVRVGMTGTASTGTGAAGESSTGAAGTNRR